MLKKLLMIFNIVFFLELKAQEMRFYSTIPTASNCEYKKVNNQLNLSFHQYSDTIPGYYVLVKINSQTNEKIIVHTQEVVNTPLKRVILVCMQDIYTPGYNEYFLKKINTPKELIAFKNELKLIQVADSLYFIRVTKE